MSTLKIVGISGSLRTNSYNSALLRAAQELAPDGTTFEILDIGALPLFNQDDEQNPPQAVRCLLYTSPSPRD